MWRAAAGGEFSWRGKQKEGSLDGHRMDRTLGLPLPNHLLNPGIGSAVKPSREQWARKNGGQRSGKRRAKVRKAEGKSQESGGQRPGKRRAKVRKAEGKGQESGEQSKGKRSALLCRSVPMITVPRPQYFAVMPVTEIGGPGGCVLYVFVSQQANRSLFLCSEHRSMTLRLQVCDATAGAKTASL